MRLELHIGGELIAEMTFDNIKVDNFTREEAFNRRKVMIDERIKMLKKEYLRGHKAKLPYEIYFVQQSRAYCTNIKLEKKSKQLKDYRPEGRSTFSHRPGRTNIADTK